MSYKVLYEGKIGNSAFELPITTLDWIKDMNRKRMERDMIDMIQGRRLYKPKRTETWIDEI